MANENWVIVPAAGTGRRMKSSLAKQYLQIAERSILFHTIEILTASAAITGIVLVGDQNDWPEDVFSLLKNKQWLSTTGGAERCHSVLNGLNYLAENTECPDSISVLVHDAARPCVRLSDLEKLITTVAGTQQGGILAIPVSDTVKKSVNQDRIESTVDRKTLWNAQTPQMFLLTVLRKALQDAFDQGKQVTDEALAMELAGFHPKLIEGHTDNIKITRPEDLAMAEFFLQQQGRL